MKRSKLAIWSFILSLLPIVIPLALILWTLISFPGTQVTTEDGELLETIVASDITLGGIMQLTAYVAVGTSFVTFWFAILSIIFGIIALVKIKKYQLGGKGLAITGIILSAIILLATLIAGLTLI